PMAATAGLLPRAGPKPRQENPSGLVAVLAAEPLHPAARRHDALLALAGVERMALGADLDPQVLHRGARLKALAAGAGDPRPVVRWVNARLHRPFPSPYALRPPACAARPGRHCNIIAHEGGGCRRSCDRRARA